jgi:chromosome segregation ATPase
LQVLEGRLMITDESMSQSSDVFQVRLMQLDSEVRKLWDNVWKKAKQRLAEQDKAIKALQADVQKSEVLEAELKQQLVQTRLALEVVEDQVDSRADASEELAVLMGQWDAQQRSLAETSTSLEVLQQANDDTQQRLQGTDEWVDSFNGYRTQINRKLLDLQGAVNALQGP